MYFRECERLVQQHPDLAPVFERLDVQLGEMGPPEVIRPEDLASFLRIDRNKIRSALDLLAREGLLIRSEMIECAHCEMAAPQSDYEAALDEDGEYRCTSCDRLLTRRTIRLITAYHRGPTWPTASVSRSADGSTDSPVRDARSTSASNPALDEFGWYTYDRLAQVFEVGRDSLRKRLDRFRTHKLDGWKQNDDRRPREPKYLYQLRAVRTVIEELRASSERPAK